MRSPITDTVLAVLFISLSKATVLHSLLSALVCVCVCVEGTDPLEGSVNSFHAYVQKKTGIISYLENNLLESENAVS